MKKISKIEIWFGSFIIAIIFIESFIRIDHTFNENYKFADHIMVFSRYLIMTGVSYFSARVLFADLPIKPHIREYSYIMLGGLIVVHLLGLLSSHDSILIIINSPFFVFSGYFLVNYLTLDYYYNQKGANSIAPNQQTNFIDDIEDSLKSYFQSDKFLTPFNEVLPKGEKDESLGLDYIPYMLKSLSERRERFKRSANRFLVGVVTLGVMSILSILGLGYVVMNESSVGIYRNVATLENDLKDLNRHLLDLKDFNSNKELLAALDNKMAGLRSLKITNKDEHKKVMNCVERAEQLARDSNDVNIILDSLRFILEKGMVTDVECAATVRNMTTWLEDYQTSKVQKTKELSLVIQELDKVVQETKKSLNQPNTYLQELIKRIVLGFIIVSFLLTILRYLAKLYQNEHRQRLIAEQEEFLVRKFYVVLKSGNFGNEHTRDIAKHFLNMTFQDDKGAKDEGKVSEGEKDLIKGLMEVLSKKI